MTQISNTQWQVNFSNKAKKQRDKLPDDLQYILTLLCRELQEEGPIRKNWPHYGKIKGKSKDIDMHHCHLNKSRSCYVAVWVIVDNDVQVMEVRYVGTHEKTDYRRIN